MQYILAQSFIFFFGNKQFSNKTQLSGELIDPSKKWKKKLFIVCIGMYHIFAKSCCRKKMCYVGEFGNGSKMKFVANHLVHIHNVASGEAMVLGMKAGLEPETIFNVKSVNTMNGRIVY